MMLNNRFILSNLYIKSTLHILSLVDFSKLTKQEFKIYLDIIDFIVELLYFNYNEVFKS